MPTSRYKRAPTSATVRAAIQASDEAAWIIAARYGISEQTVWKWRKRDSIEDRSRIPHRLRTTLTPAQEAVSVALRTLLVLPLDDLLAIVREFLNPHVSRSGLDRCLRRHKVGNLRDLQAATPKPQQGANKPELPGQLHIELKSLPRLADDDRRRHLLVAIDRATRWVFVRVYPALSAANARRFLRDLERTAPMRITGLSTGTEAKYSARIFDPSRRDAAGHDEFDRFCAEFGIEHRLATSPQPENSSAETCFDGHIGDVLQSHHMRPGEALETTIPRYVRFYNSKLAQGALDGRTPIEVLGHWQQKRPELFK